MPRYPARHRRRWRRRRCHDGATHLLQCRRPRAHEGPGVRRAFKPWNNRAVRSSYSWTRGGRGHNAADAVRPARELMHGASRAVVRRPRAQLGRHDARKVRAGKGVLESAKGRAVQPTVDGRDVDAGVDRHAARRCDPFPRLPEPSGPELTPSRRQPVRERGESSLSRWTYAAPAGHGVALGRRYGQPPRPARRKHDAHPARRLRAICDTWISSVPA